ncbi:MAG: squalene--hopene cyclase [Cyanobacteria bacterium J06650_10]
MVLKVSSDSPSAGISSERSSQKAVKEVGYTLSQSIAATQQYLLSIQKPDGYWWADLESNASITSEAILLHKIWGTAAARPLEKAERYLRSQQKSHGGWELFSGDGGDLSVSIEAYMGLRLLGVSADDPVLVRAKSLILRKGGISKSRIFTKFHLALIGCYSWQGIPSLPAWVMLLEHPFPVNIYELSSWARGSTVPLLIVFDKKPIYPINPAFNLNELYAEGMQNVNWELPQNNDWSDIFLWLDKGFKLAESFNLVPFREEGIQQAEKWILERQETAGDWGGIIPAMLNSMLALRALDYDVADPVVQRGFEALDSFAVEDEDTYWIQPCISPVWDTALALRALVDSGMPKDSPAMVNAGNWLLKKQIIDYGDWAVKNSQGQPGGWAFEFENRFYPDVDDTAMVAMALQDITLPDEALKRAAISRAVCWIESMQCKTGGWAAFDVDNDQDWLNAIPYGDLKAMIDPSTADITARVLEMQGRLAHDSAQTAKQQTARQHKSTGLLSTQSIRTGIRYLLEQQETDGSWFGRWGVNYIYGTSGALSALAAINPVRYKAEIYRGAAWLMSCQYSDGGWGETGHIYQDPAQKGKGKSTASQTAWALLGLIDAIASPLSDTEQTQVQVAIQKGIEHLLDTQQADGTWLETEHTGTGFPCHFYLVYHLYPQVFPLMALGRYRAITTDQKEQTKK